MGENQIQVRLTQGVDFEQQETGSPVPSMNPVNLEDIAALIDGRLEGAERQRVVEHLAEDEASYEIFQEVLHLQEDMNTELAEADQAVEDDELADLVPIEALQPKPTWRRWTPTAALAMAAMLATVVIGLSIGTRIGHRNSRAVALVAESFEMADERGAVTNPDHPRSELSERLDGAWFSRSKRNYRGDSPAGETDRVDFQLGVQVVDLHIALETEKLELAKAAAERLLWLMNNDERSIFLRSEIDTCEKILAGIIAGADSSSLAEERQLLETRLERITERVYFDFGRWVEAGRLAVVAGIASSLTAVELVECRSVWKKLILTRPLPS